MKLSSGRNAVRAGLRLFGAGLVAAHVFAAPSFSFEQRDAIAIISASDAVPFLQARDGIKAVLAEKGIRKVSSYNLKTESPADVASAVEIEHPALILALGTPALTLAKEKFPDVPVVFCMTLGSKEAAHARATGVVLDIPLMEKLRRVKDIAPEMRKIGIIHSAGYPITAQESAQIQESLGIRLLTRKIASEKEVPSALEDIQWKMDLLLMVPDPAIYSSHSVLYLLQECARNSLPVVGLSSYYTKAGALFSVDCDYVDLGRQAGEIALRVLNGENPADIPFANPRRLTYSINTIVAKRLKIDIPAEILRKAGEVFGQ